MERTTRLGLAKSYDIKCEIGGEKVDVETLCDLHASELVAEQPKKSATETGLSSASFSICLYDFRPCVIWRKNHSFMSSLLLIKVRIGKWNFYSNISYLI